MGKLISLFKMREPKPAIIVSGLPRSGTSMMMAMLEAGGVPLLTDNIRPADEDNPKGYYELEAVKKLKNGDFNGLKGAQGKAVKIISALLLELPIENEYRVLFMRRAMPEILASQRKMLINRGEDPESISDEEMGDFFGNHLAKVKTWMETQKIPVWYVDYNQLLMDPEPNVSQINAFLGGDLDVERMLAVIDPSLYRQRVKKDPSKPNKTG